MIQFGGVGFFKNFRDLVIRSPKFQSEQKLLQFLSVIGFIYMAYWLIDMGKLNVLLILFLQIPLLWFDLFMGIVEGALKKWKEQK